MTKDLNNQTKINGFDVLENLEQQELLQQLTPRDYALVDLKDFIQAIKSTDTAKAKNKPYKPQNQDQEYMESLNLVVSRFYKYLDRAVDFVKAYTLNINNPSIMGIIADLVDYYATNRGDISESQQHRYKSNIDTLKAIHSNKIKLDQTTQGEEIPPTNAPSMMTSTRYRDRIWGN